MADIKGALCPHCATPNNFYADQAIAARCGRCERELFEGRALTVLPHEILRHSPSGEAPPGKIPTLLICFGRIPGQNVRIDCDRYARRYEPHLRVLTIDPLEHDEVWKRYALRGVPTGLLLRDGREVDRTMGAPSDKRDPIAQMLRRQGIEPTHLFGGAPATEA
ncbi:MAG: thioredoxin family protein [Caulobacter sp.]